MLLQNDTNSMPKIAPRPLVELLLLAAPTIVQMSSYTLMQFTDSWMLSRAGELQATAAGQAGLAVFCLIGFGFGVLMVVNTLVSQSFGRSEPRLCGRHLWQGIWFGIGLGMFSLVVVPFAGRIFASFGHDPQLAAYEGDYARVLILSGAVRLAATAIGQFLIGVQRPAIVLVGALTGAVINLPLTWMLIFGRFGIPALGVAGAAWGTNAAICIELLITAIYVFRPAMVRRFNTLDIRPRGALFRTLLRIGVPAGFQFICDIAAWSTFILLVIGKFGTSAMVANNFAFRYMHVSFMPAFGVGAAVTALVGKYIGMKRPDLARRRAHLGFAVCAIYMVICGACFFFGRNVLMRFFTHDPQVIRIGGTLLIFMAAYQIFDAMFIVYAGALRGAGDTLVPAAVQGAMVWSIVVGGGVLIATRSPRLGVAGPWSAATLFGILLGIFLLLRFRAGRWMAIHLENDDSPKSAISAVAPAA